MIMMDFITIYYVNVYITLYNFLTLKCFSVSPAFMSISMVSQGSLYGFRRMVSWGFQHDFLALIWRWLIKGKHIWKCCRWDCVPFMPTSMVENIYLTAFAWVSIIFICLSIYFVTCLMGYWCLIYYLSKNEDRCWMIHNVLSSSLVLLMLKLQTRPEMVRYMENKRQYCED